MNRITMECDANDIARAHVSLDEIKVALRDALHSAVRAAAIALQALETAEGMSADLFRIGPGADLLEALDYGDNLHIATACHTLGIDVQALTRLDETLTGA